MNSDDRRSFERDGFLIFREPLVDASRVSRAREGMDAVRAGAYDTGRPPETSPWNPGDDPSLLCKIEQPQLANRAIAELIRSPEIGAAAARATGASMIQVWWVQLLYKPASAAGSTAPTRVGWHRDWTYWDQTWKEGSELLTAWFALSDVDEDAGPMKFVPGSHRWEGVGGGDFFSQELSASDFAVPPGATWRETSATMRAGGMSLHDKLLVHGSGRNVSTGPRRSFAIHLRTDKSYPLHRERMLLSKYLDDLEACPIVYGKKVAAAFG